MANKSITYQISTVLIYIASLTLVFVALLARQSVLAGSDFPFFAGAYLVFFGACLVVAIGSAVLGYRGLWQRWWLANVPLTLVWIPGSLALTFVLPALYEPLRDYFIAILLWLVLLHLAAIVLLAGSAQQAGTLGKALQFTANSFVILLLTLGIIEVGLRAWFTFFGSENDKIAYLYSSDEILAIVRQRSYITPKAYLNFYPTPHYADINSRGYRGIEITTPKPEGTFRIAALGGSTTYGFGLEAWQQAYPAQLERILHEDYGYSNIEVINAGVIHFSSFDTLVNLIYRVLDDDPDLIITYDGINDINPRLISPARYNGSNEIRQPWFVNGRSMPGTVLERFVAINTGAIPNPNSIDWVVAADDTTQICSNPTFCAEFNMTPQELLDANPPIYFERNVRNIISIAQTNGVQTVLSTWAYFPEPSNNNLYMTYPYIQNAVAEHNAITRQVGAEMGVPVIDLAATMPYVSEFWLDGMHMTPTGTDEQARQYAAFLIENNLLPKPTR